MVHSEKHCVQKSVLDSERFDRMGALLEDLAAVVGGIVSDDDLPNTASRNGGASFRNG
jgi:hypothetical protein